MGRPVRGLSIVAGDLGRGRGDLGRVFVLALVFCARIGLLRVVLCVLGCSSCNFGILAHVFLVGLLRVESKSLRRSIGRLGFLGSILLFRGGGVELGLDQRVETIFGSEILWCKRAISGRGNARC